MSSSGACLFLGTFDDKEYVPMLKGMFYGRNTFVVLEPFTLLAQLEIYCAKRNVTAVVCTNTAILHALVKANGDHVSKPKLSDYAGSLFTHKGIEIVFISPLRQLHTVSYGKFLAARFISKVADPESWPEPTKFDWSIATPTNIENFYVQFSAAFAIAVDIETFKENLAIRCISYTAVFVSSTGLVSTKTIVFPINDPFFLVWMRKFNEIPVPKITQKGKYDNSYLLRYNAPLSQWYWDTANLFHSWYSELPKDLAGLNAFCVREVVYWKDLADTTDLHEYYRYNGLDTWATANVWIQELLQMPEWAKRNYLLEFPLVFPCILSEMTGLVRDEQRHIAAREKIDADVAKELTSLRNCLGQPKFNPNSPKQVLTLLHILGCKDITSSGEIFIKKAMLRHPLNAFLLEKILKIRGWNKLKGTYLRLDSDAKDDSDPENTGGAKEYRGFYLYKLDPDGTDNGRLASKAHHFWCGGNVQNIPRGELGEPNYVKSTLRAPVRFFIGECDLKQAESWDTGYISGDPTLISAVNSTRDFHASNASSFFGVPYDKIFSDEIKKTLDKKLRDLSKRTNHGANYNMGITVLIDTMGIDKVWEAKRLLRLPYQHLEEVAEHLLTVFHLVYSTLRGPIKIRNENVRLFLKLPPCTNKFFAPGTYYAKIVEEVSISKRVTSRAYHHTEWNLEHYRPEEYIRDGDWTRFCFGKPSENKLDLNALIAHPPASLNARTLNEGYMRIFYEIALPEAKDFRLNAQIHDSSLFCYRQGREDLAERVKLCMEIPVSVRDVHGHTRTFTVPADLKLGKTVGGNLQRSVYWDETE